jgi:hypothetical protein
MTSYGINLVNDSTSSLELNSFSKGIIPSRMSLTEKNLISSPIEGSVVYDYSSKSMSYYNGIRWVNITAS